MKNKRVGTKKQFDTLDTCETCVFCKLTFTDNTFPTDGYCRKSPPVFIGVDSSGYPRFTFPPVKPGDWCGEHKTVVCLNSLEIKKENTKDKSNES